MCATVEEIALYKTTACAKKDFGGLVVRLKATRTNVSENGHGMHVMVMVSVLMKTSVSVMWDGTAIIARTLLIQSHVFTIRMITQTSVPLMATVPVTTHVNVKKVGWDRNVVRKYPLINVMVMLRMHLVSVVGMECVWNKTTVPVMKVGQEMVVVS